MGELPLTATVLDTAPLAAVAVGADGTVRLWNRATERMSGWAADDVIGGADPSVLPEDLDHARRRLAELWDDPSLARRRVVQRRRPDGTIISIVLEACERVELDDGPALLFWFDSASSADVLFAMRSSVARRLVAATRRDEVDPVVLDAVVDLLGASAAIALRRCPQRAHLHGDAGFGTDLADVEAVRLDLDPGAGTPWNAALNGHVSDGQLEVGGVTWHARFTPMGPTGTGMVLAVLHDAELPSSPLATDLALGIADEVYGALQRVDLVAELDGKIEILEATNALAASVGLDLDAVLAAVVGQACSALSCERAAVYLLDDDGVLALAQLRDTTSSASAPLRDGDGLGLARQVVARGDVVLHQDLAEADVERGPWHPDAGAVAVFGLPLRVAGRVTGALVVAHTDDHPRGFTRLCTQVGAAVAQQAAIALEHARLYRVERETVERLVELDRMKADWMAGLTHDLKGPLTGLVGFTETMRRLEESVSPTQRRQFLDVMSRQAETLVELVEDMLLSARIDAGAVARRQELVVVRALVDDVLAGLPPSRHDRVTVVDHAVDSRVVGDPMHLRRVMRNLLGNAWRHGASQVTIELDRTDGQVVVAVEDDGPGIAPDERERIFDRFSHGHTDGSTGLGLFVARGIVEAHGGTIAAEEPRHGGGARFVLRLPHGRPLRDGDLDEVEDDRPAATGRLARRTDDSWVGQDGARR